jgi:transposase-like protein
VDEEDRANWVCKDLNDDDEEETAVLQQVLSLLREEMSIRAIASKLDINRMKVQRLLKKAERLEKAGKLTVSPE